MINRNMIYLAEYSILQCSAGESLPLQNSWHW